MKTRKVGATLVLGAILTAAGAVPMAWAQAPAQPVWAVDQHNLEKDKLAIEGYDPVGYFPEGGGKPIKGDAKFELTHRGAKYRFANQQNLDAFKADPDKYEPAHGGWCTYAMGEAGEKVEVDPKSFVVENGRLFLFYKDLFNDTRAKYLKNSDALRKKADANWQKTTGEKPRGGGTLKAKLDAVSAKAAERMPPEQVKKFAEGVEQAKATGVESRALQVGAAAPDFTLPEAKGKMVTLSTMLKDGPVVLTWYRGGWCPYCNLQLVAYQEKMADFKAAGAQLVAISPQVPDGSASTADKNKLEFSVVSDVGNTTAKAYGLAYKVPPAVEAMYKTFLPKANGDESMELPVSAVYIVGRDGKIKWAKVDADYRVRAEPEEIMAALKELKN
ncbi:MAG: redoxin domain-containing protein [Phycisphaerales bacterium]|nr:redoxin domain-containing protein [Phycisphaerales bacterium]